MIRLRSMAAATLAALALAGCAAESVWAPDDVVSRAAYRAEGPTRVVLLTAISNSTGAGGHSALLIDGAQRVIFDPAGSWHHPNIPERNDVLFGMSPVYFDFYMDYHARETYHMVVQELEVSPQTAAALSAAVQSHGAVPAAQCSRSISSILAATPGFQNVRETWFPRAMMERFGEIPGVTTTQVFDDDSDDNLELLQRQAALARVRGEAAEILATE